MRCPSCHHDNRSDRRFCTQCGTKLAMGCPSCGAPIELAEKIRQAKATVEGERKQVSVLFVDVKGSMELAEHLDPEAWSQIMQRFFLLFCDSIERFEGFVDKFIGDGAMALFGAPIAHEDHAQRACYAALHLRDAVRAYAGEVRAQHDMPFAVRIGLNSGEVVVGRIGDDLHMEFTAQGHVVGLAQRMEAAAESGHICLSEHTARLVEGYFQLQDLGRITVKGVSEPVRHFDLEAVGSFRTRFDRSRARGLSAFVGRAHEMAALDAALARARGGSGQVVGVVGEAGTGKSRLCAEFVERCRARGIPILEGRGVAHGKAIPMLPMLEMWRAFYEIGDDEGPETTRAKIADRLLLMDESYREVLPFIFDLFGVPDPANPSPAIDPEQRQKRIHGVLRQVLHDPAYDGRHVILLEDLHWFDGASDTYLQTTVENLPATRNLLVVTFRPEYHAPWMERPYYQRLLLQPLDPEAIHALLRDQLGEDPSVARLPQIIHARTKGNPFFTEEVVQSLVDGGQLAGGRGAYRLATPVEALQVPASVQAVLSSRIDRLPEREKEVLQTAAVIGKTFDETLLGRVMASVTTTEGTALGPALSTLAAAEFLYEAALYPQLEYSFKHPLTQEVAQRSQLRERRVRVHAAVAHALAEAGGNLDERAAEIAQHWDEAGAAGHAARWHRRAAEWAGLSDPRESLRHWRRVRELAPGVEDASERTNLALQACDQILSLGWRMGGSEEEAATAFAEGRALVESLGDRPALALLVARYGLIRFSVAGSAGDYARHAEEAALLARACGDPTLRVAIGSLAAYGHFHVGEGRAALEWSARVLDEVGSDNMLGKKLGGYSPRAGALHVRAQALMFLGRLTEAWNQIQAAQRVVEESSELEVFTWMQITRSLLEYTCGRSESGLEYGRRSLEIAEKLDNEACRMAAYAALGLANLVAGQPSAARDALRESATIARDRRVVRALLPLVLAGLAEAHLALGEVSEAVATAREGIDLGSAGGCLYNEALAQLALAAALLATDGVVRRAEIESALERAEHLAASIEGNALSPR